MPRKYNAKQKEYLLSADRVKTLDTHRVMSFLPLMVYQDVADVGIKSNCITGQRSPSVSGLG